jgi:hypothetical protein
MDLSLTYRYKVDIEARGKAPDIRNGKVDLHPQTLPSLNSSRWIAGN